MSDKPSFLLALEFLLSKALLRWSLPHPKWILKEDENHPSTWFHTIFGIYTCFNKEYNNKRKSVVLSLK